jgi:thymidylate kinase
VDAADAGLGRFKAAHGFSSFDTERDLLLHRRDDAARTAAASGAAVLQLRQRLATMAAQLAVLAPALEFYHDTDIAGRITNVKATVEALRAKQSELLTHYQPDSRPALDLARQIAEQSAALEALLRDRSATSDRVGRNPERDTIALDRAHAQSDLVAAQAANDAARAEVAALNETLEALDASEPELRSRIRRRDALEDNFRDLSRLLAERRMVEEAQARAAASVRVIERAMPPAQPHRLALLILVGGAFLGLVAGAATVTVAAAARRTFLSPARLERQLQLPVLASVPDLAVGRRPGK